MWRQSAALRRGCEVIQRLPECLARSQDVELGQREYAGALCVNRLLQKNVPFDTPINRPRRTIVVALLSTPDGPRDIRSCRCRVSAWGRALTVGRLISLPAHVIRTIDAGVLTLSFDGRGHYA